MADLNTLKNKLAGKTSPKEAPKAPASENDKKVLPPKKAKGGRNYIPNGKGRGGNRGGGRPPNESTLIARSIKAFMAEHANEVIPYTFKDPVTGKKVTVNKPRSAIAMEVLFALGTGQTAIGSADALNKWFDRYIGKPAQPIRGEGEDDAPIQVNVSVEDMLRKVYGEKDEE